MNNARLLWLFDEKESKALYVGFLQYGQIFALAFILIIILIYCSGPVWCSYRAFKLLFGSFGCFTLGQNLANAIIFQQEGRSGTTSFILFLRRRLLGFGLWFRLRGLLLWLLVFKRILVRLRCFLLYFRISRSFASITIRQRESIWLKL